MPHPEGHSESESTRPPISAVNFAAAEWLERLAADLELEEPRVVRRIAAYRLAAGALRRSPLRVEDLWRAGREQSLTQIEHLTPPIAQVVGELIATKRLALPPGEPSVRRRRR